VLDLRRMNRILDIDEANHLCRVEPAALIADLQNTLRGKGLFFPTDPTDAGALSVGGVAAKCSVGLRAGRYGVTRDYFSAIEVVLPTGEVLQNGARTLRRAGGYDLTRLFVGTRGTLGVFTCLALRLLPVPEATTSLAMGFPTGQAAAEGAASIVERQIVPVAMSFLDHSALSAAAAYRRGRLGRNVRALLLVDVDGEREAVKRQVTAVLQACRGAGMTAWSRGDTPKASNAIWETRRAVEPALSGVAPHRLDQNIRVLPSHAPVLVQRIEAIRRRTGAFAAVWGRIGDGELHVAIMHHEDTHSEHVAREAGRDIVRAALDMGDVVRTEGDLSPDAPTIPPVEMKVMRQLKDVFDPNGILNPGVLFSG
jgi:glycolate oxidase